MPKIAVQLVADILGYTRGLEKAQKQTLLFADGVEASGKKIGHGFALATGGLVAFTGATEVLKASIDAARDAGVAQRQLAAQVKASGQSFQASQAAISKAELSLEKFGFTSEDSTKALTVLERGTGNITRAISLQGAAADLARAKNIGLSDAANVLAKVFGGQETALRRAVPGLEKHAHGLQLIAEAQQRLAGQARAGTTESEKFSATLHDSEVIIGQALLPTLNKLLGSLGDWLDKANRTGRLQRDLNSAVETGTGVIEGMRAILGPVVELFKQFGDAVGGTKKEVELLGLAFAGWKVQAWLEGIGLLTGGIKGVGTSAATTKGEVAGLKGSLVGLGEAAAIAISVGGVISELQKKASLKATGATAVLGGSLLGHKVGDPPFLDPALGTFVTLQKINGELFFVPSATPAPAGLAGPVGTRGTGTTVPPGLTGPITASAAAAAAGRSTQLTPEQRLQIALAASPNNIGLLQQQAGFDRSSIAFLQRLHAQGKGPGPTKLASELEGFYNDLNSMLSTIQGINQAAADKIAATRKKSADAAKKASDAAKKAAAAALAATRAAIGRAALGVSGSFALHGLSVPELQAFNVPAGIQLAEARTTATGNTAGFDKALRSARTAARRALKSGRLSIQAQIDAWNAIADVNQQLANQAKKTSVDVTKRHQAPLPRAFALAGGGGLTINGGLHLHGIQDVANLENELEARAKRRPQPRRGR